MSLLAMAWANGRPLVWPAIVLVGAILLALVVHYVVFLLLKRLARRKAGVVANSLVQHAERPTRWVFPLLAIVLVLPTMPVKLTVITVLQRIAGLGVIGTIAWVIILLADVSSDVAFSRYRLDIADNLASRRIRTQISVLQRIFNVIVIFITVGVMLLTFPDIRQVGTSLLASAGIAGLVLGVALRPTLTNLIAGVQIALTEPIRIEDVVIVQGEFGWIEEILTTYVVVRTWDLRRLVVPLSYFIENTFQNWTRNTADLLAYVYLYCDYTVPVDELREEFRRILEADPLWDKKVCVLQVTDATEHSVQIRALASASDSGKAWDLRCHVREKLIRYLQEKYPQSLPVSRVDYRTQMEEPMTPLPMRRQQAQFGSREPVPTGAERR